jgi:ubiquinol oxidase
MLEEKSPGGPVTAQLSGRSPFGAMERLDHEDLVKAQRESAEAPRRRYSLSARALFAVMDALYRKARTLPKFRVLELVARVPYQAWENVAYVAVTHTARQPGFARRVFDTVRLARWEQDNEQWHLLILEELTGKGPRLGFFRHRVVPQVPGVRLLPTVLVDVRSTPGVELPAERRLRGPCRARVRPPRRRAP